MYTFRLVFAWILSAISDFTLMCWCSVSTFWRHLWPQHSEGIFDLNMCADKWSWSLVNRSKGGEMTSVKITFVLSLKLFKFDIILSLWWFIYIYIYIYVCVCVCVCVILSKDESSKVKTNLSKDALGHVNR